MVKESSKKFIQSLKFPIAIIICLWVIHIYQFVTGGSFGSWGIYPQHISGMRGILVAPLIHGDFNHLISNTFPLFVLTLMILYFYRRVAFQSFALIYLLTGFTVWLFARPVFHIGASGVVYGLLSFVFWSGVFRRNIRSIVLALIVTILYSGYIWGVLPIKDGVSWESHLYGGLVGILVAFIYRRSLEESEEEVLAYTYEEDVEEDQQYFFDRDIFNS